MGRFVSLEDVARAVALLAELEQSAFVNATLRGREGRAGTGRGLLGERWVAQAELSSCKDLTPVLACTRGVCCESDVPSGRSL
jgi:hypothetical protein